MECGTVELTDSILSAGLPVVLLGIVAVFIFESVKADMRAAAKPCICRHPNKDHVKYKDWDSSTWIPGAEYKPGQCRKCKCKSFRFLIP